jgi:hypothetical protein
LDLKQLIVAIHPVGWIRKYVNDADVVGVNLEVEVDSENFGAFVGQKGVFVRFLDDVLRNLLGIGLRAKSVETKGKEEKGREGKRKARK